MKRILVIDDERSIRNTFRFFLENAGYYVITSEDAEKAYELIKRDNFDLIITDCIMPKVSGLELLTKLRTNNDFTPVIIITGEPVEKNKTMSFELKASAYLSKPISKEVLLNVVIRIFK